MPNKRMLKPLAFVALACTSAVLYAQTSVLLPVERDVQISYHDNYNTANTNYNWAPHMAAVSTAGSQGGENNGRGLLDFDLSVIPADSVILGAFLNLTAKGPFGAGPVGSVGSTGQNSCTVRRVIQFWDDATVTWNTQPTTTMQNAVPLAPSVHPLQNYYNIDVTALVRDMVADPANSHGFMIMLDDETPECGMIFHGGLATYADQHPSLLVVYGSCDMATGMTEEPGADGGLRLSANLVATGDPVQLSIPGAPQRPVRLDVVDAAGRTAWSSPIAQWPLAWTVPTLSAGAYVVAVVDSSGQLLGSARMSVR